jgi:DNA-binding CsgD family transcriptional regulator
VPTPGEPETSSAPVVVRAAESVEIGRFLDALASGSRCLLLEGEVGIGKTTLLRWAKESASDRGYRVLSASPVEMEVPWEFAALADLLETVPKTVVDELPESQRRAVGVAVFRDEPPDIPVDPRTLATAVLRIVRRLAEETPVVLAVDDLPLLDAPSARVLSYVLRRVRDAAVGLLGAVRVEWSTEPAPLVTDSVEPHRVARVSVGALGLEAMSDLLATRTGLTLGRSGLVRVHELSRGNPLFALELVGENATELAADPGRSVSVPESLRRLVRRRVSPLTASARDVLLVAALSGEPSQAVVSAAAADPQGAGQDLERVVRAGVIQRRGDDLTFAHPLIRSVVADDATTAQRRATHRRLASAVRHREVRARHLALGAEGPDEHVARAVEDASVSAAARGACETAATLAELAVSLTPPDRVDDRLRRIAIEAENRFEASEPARACTLLEAVVEDMPPGPARAELLRRLARYSAFRGEPLQWMTMLNRALDESGDDQALRCTIAMDLAVAANNFGDEATARKHTALAMELAEQSGDAAVQAQLYAGMAFVAFSRGEGVQRDLIERGLSGPEQPFRLGMELRPRVVTGHVLHLSDDLDGARALYELERVRASGEGVETELPLLLWGLIDTEAWAGNWDRAEELAAEGTELADDVRSPTGALMAAMNGLLHVYRGRLDEGLRDCELAAATAMEIKWPLAALLAAQGLGLSGLSVGDAFATHERLAPVMSLVLATGVTEPGLLHFLPDEIEALVRLGDLDSANELLSSLETRSDALGRVWGVAASGRCRGLLLAASGDFGAADAAIGRALDAHRQLPMPFEHGRTLLVAGEIARRSRRKRQAQEALEAAAAIFGGLGAPVWEQRAREELGRVGRRATQPPGPGTELTEAERTVAELVADGHTNAEVAARLFMGQRTVEAHLSRIYRKLGIHSRTQLSRALPPASS